MPYGNSSSVPRVSVRSDATETLAPAHAALAQRGSQAAGRECSVWVMVSVSERLRGSPRPSKGTPRDTEANVREWYEKLPDRFPPAG